MTRARENADGARLDAPLASPAFTGTPTGITAAHLEAGVLPSDVTGGSGLTALGTVTAGTLGSGVVFNDSHKDIDFDADSWEIVQAASTQMSSNGIVDYGYTSKMGSNCSVSGGVIEVGKAGWYLIICKAGHQALYDQSMQLFLQISDPDGTAGNATMVNQTGRIYTSESNLGMGYWGISMTWFTYLRDTDHCQMYGTGYIYGNTTNDATLENAMNKFSGVRLGA